MSKRTHQKLSTAELSRLLERFTKAEVASELGVSTASLSEWMRKGEMPTVAARACEGLLRRFREKESRPQTLVVKCTTAQTETVTQVLEGLKCTIFVVPFND